MLTRHVRAPDRVSGGVSLRLRRAPLLPVLRSEIAKKWARCPVVSQEERFSTRSRQRDVEQSTLLLENLLHRVIAPRAGYCFAEGVALVVREIRSILDVNELAFDSLTDFADVIIRVLCGRNLR